MGKEISSTIIFTIFIKKVSPSHNWLSELFIHEGRLVTSNMFFLYRGMGIKYFRENVFKFFKFRCTDFLQIFSNVQIFQMYTFTDFFNCTDFW